MNRRQMELLKILLENKLNYLSAQELANRLGCSEKSVRNDAKVLDTWLKHHTKAVLQRKPGYGLRILISEGERKTLYEQLSLDHTITAEEEKRERIARILEILLIGGKPATLQKLADLFYVNKNVIKKDIDQIRDFLQEENLKLIIKRKLGIEIRGDEYHKRLSIAKIASFLGYTTQRQLHFFSRFFTPQEIKAVEHSLKDLNVKENNPYTDESLSHLIIHLLIAIKRVKLGHPISLTASRIKEVAKKKEYQKALTVMRHLEPSLALHFPESEIAYMAQHFMGGKLQKAFVEEENEVIKSVTKEIIETTSKRIGINLAQDQTLYAGMLVHIQSTIERLQLGLSVTNPMLDAIKRTYPYLFDVLLSESNLLKEIVGYDIPEEEIAYLTLHFEAALERLHKREEKHKTVLIVCPLGIGTSELLRSKLERKFHMLDVANTASQINYHRYLDQPIDFIISTIPLPNAPLPVVVVSPFLTADDESQIIGAMEGNFISGRVEEKTSQFPHLRALIKEERILLQLSLTHPFEVIEHLGARLLEEGVVKKGFTESAIRRERLSSTSIGSGIAIPHGDPSLVIESATAVGVMYKPLLWGKEYASLIFLIATKQEDFGKTRNLFAEISQLCDRLGTIQALTRQKTAKDFLESLSGL